MDPACGKEISLDRAILLKAEGLLAPWLFLLSAFESVETKLSASKNSRQSGLFLLSLLCYDGQRYRHKSRKCLPSLSHFTSQNLDGPHEKLMSQAIVLIVSNDTING